MDLMQHLRRQMAWSRATFGPGERRKGVADHIRKELVEIDGPAPLSEVEEAAFALADLLGSWGPTEDEIAQAKDDMVRAVERAKATRAAQAVAHPGDPREWTDVVILGLDGLWRSLAAVRQFEVPFDHSIPWTHVPLLVCTHIQRKQGKNEQRVWPDWRGRSEDEAIEHVRD